MRSFPTKYILFCAATLALIPQVSLAQLNDFKVEGFECPSGNPFNNLKVGEYAQRPGQPRCKSASGGFHDKRCPEGIITGSFYYIPLEGGEASWPYYTTFFSCMDKGKSLKHTVDANGNPTVVCRPDPTEGQQQREPKGCCKPVSSPGAVNVEGSGILKDGRVLEYDGKVHANKCADVFGGPTVLAGGSRKCLIPFISVACDKKTYPYGTIFEVPTMRGKVFPMPPKGKRTFRHPGYLICEDTGSAITGPGRFDFFVGTFGDTDKLNYLGSKSSGPANLRVSVENCNKPFRAIRIGDPDWKKGIDAIILATRNGLPSKDYSIWLTGPINAPAPVAAKPAQR